MKKIFLLFALSVSYLLSFSQNVGVGTTTPNASAELDVTSTSRGLLPPRMTTAQRDLIPSPAAGLIIYNSTTTGIEFYNGTTWINLGALFTNTPFKKMYGGNNVEVLSRIIQTPDGGFVIAGYSFPGTSPGTIGATVSNGAYDCWIMKLDALGNIQWQKLFGGDSFDRGLYISLTADGGYVVAGLSLSSNTGTLTGITNNGYNDYYITKLDANGNIQWQKLFGGSDDDQCKAAQQTADGGYIVAGYAFPTNTGTQLGLASHGGYEDWIMKLDASGTIVWQKFLGGSLDESAYTVQQTTDGGYIIAGDSHSSNSGNVTSTTFGNADYWIVKLDGAGNVLWQKLLGGTASETAYNLQQTTDGGYIVVGSSASSNTGTLLGQTNNGGNDYWILKLDATGNVVWQKLYGGNLDDVAKSVRQTADGGYIIGGQSNSAAVGTLSGLIPNGGYDFWVLKLDATGNIQWQKLLGGSLDDFCTSVIQTTDGNYVVAGSTASSNTGTLAGVAGNGSTDALIIKLDKYGNPF